MPRRGPRSSSATAGSARCCRGCGPSEALTTQARYSELAKIELAETLLFNRRYDEALGALGPLLRAESPPTRAVLLEGRIAQGKGDADTAAARLRLGLELEKMRREAVSTNLDLEALGLALETQGKPAEAMEAYRRAIELDPLDARKTGAFGRLLELLKKKPPQPSNDQSPQGKKDAGDKNAGDEEYYRVLEKQTLARRADPESRMNWRAGINPGGRRKRRWRSGARWPACTRTGAEAHRALAPLALKLGQPAEARASWQVLQMLRPDDPEAAAGLEECKKQLNRQDAKGAKGTQGSKAVKRR